MSPEAIVPNPPESSDMIEYNRLLKYWQHYFQNQNETLLAESRITFAKEVQEIKEEYSNLGGSAYLDIRDANKTLMLEACTNWAIKNQI